MSLPTKKHTAGNRRRFVVDYLQWMNEGTTMFSFTATSSSLTATVDGAAIQGDDTGVFFVNDGVADETFDVSLTMTTSYGEIKHDTVPFIVVA